MSIVPKLTQLLEKEQSSTISTIGTYINQRAVAAGVVSTALNQETSITGGNTLGASLTSMQIPPLIAQATYTGASPAAGRPPVALGSSNTNLNSGATLDNSRFIFLTVNINNDYRLAQIKAIGVHDDNFFDALKREYIAKRGLMRFLFSIWRYSGCDFVKVSKCTLYINKLSLLIPFSLRRLRSVSTCQEAKGCPTLRTLNMSLALNQLIQCLQLADMSLNVSFTDVIRAVKSTSTTSKDVEDSAVRKQMLWREYLKETEKSLKKETSERSSGAYLRWRKFKPSE